jgi:hypothetical protein
VILSVVQNRQNPSGSYWQHLKFSQREKTESSSEMIVAMHKTTRRHVEKTLVARLPETRDIKIIVIVIKMIVIIDVRGCSPRK